MTARIGATVVVLLAAALGASALVAGGSAGGSERDRGFGWTFSTPPVEISRAPGGTSHKIVVEGFGTLPRRPGAPSVPFKTVRIAIPENAAPSLAYDIRSEHVRAGVVPVAVPRVVADVRRFPDGLASVLPEGFEWKRGVADRDLGVRAREVFEPDPALYAGATPTPEAVAWLGETGRFRDQRYVEVHVAPVRYDPTVSGLRIATELELYVDFGTMSEPSTSGSASLSTAGASDPLEPVYRDQFLNYGQGRSFRESTDASTAATDSLTPTVPEPRYRVTVTEPEIVRLDFGRMSGTPLASEPLSSWIVVSRGVEVPVEVFDLDGDDVLDSGDWVQFVGQPLTEEPETVLNKDLIGSPSDLYEARDFSDVAVYFVGSDAGAARSRMEPLDGAPTFSRTPPADFEATARAEVDDAWFPLGGADPWYWNPSLDSSAPSNERSRTESVPLPGLASTTAPIDVRVHVRGVTENLDLDPDHRTLVELRNGNQTLASQEGAFDNRTLFLHEFAWDGASGSSADPIDVRIEALSVTGGHTVIPDFIELDYRRSFTAIDDTLQFRWPDGDAEFEISGLASGDVYVYEVTSGVGDSAVFATRRVTGVSVSGGGPFTARFRVDDDPAVPNGELRTFVVTGAGAVVVPGNDRFSADTVSDLRDPSIQADLIVVAHPDLLDDTPGSLYDQYVAFRASEIRPDDPDGVTTKLAWLPDVEDEFNDGHAGPLAIRNFASWVMSAEGWAEPKPRYLLLVGDGSFDYKGGTAAGNYLPTQILFKDDPTIGYYASDNLLALATPEDQLADLSVGRFPSRTLQETDDLFAKVLDYGQSPPSGTWTRHAVFVSDRGKGSDPVFEALEFEEINALGRSEMKIPPHTEKTLRYYSDFGGNQPSAMRQAIKDAVNGADEFSGAAMMQYQGHGNFVVWSDDAFFDERNPPPRDTEDLVNGGRLPWLIVHNCLTGGFHTPDAFSMGENWVQRVGGGSLATYAPSGLGFRFIGEPVTDELWGDVYGPPKIREIGVTTLNSLARLCGQGSTEACQYYVLLGDPSTVLELPTIAPPTDEAATAGEVSEQVTVSWTESDTPGVVYDVYRTADLKQPYQLAQGGITGAGPTLSYVDTGLVNTTTYYYYVLARDAEGFESAWSNFNADCDVEGPDCLSATPLNPNPPPAPTGVVAVDAETGGRIDVSWDASPEDDVRRYTVYYGTAPGVYDTSVNAGNNTSTALTGLENGTQYYIVVTATNTSGKESSSSSEVDAVPTFILGQRAPAFVDDLTVDVSGSDIVLSWGAITTDIHGKPDTISAYEVYRGATPDFVPSPADKIGETTQTTFTDPGAALASAGNGYYLVRAVDVDGLGGGLGFDLPNGIRDLAIAKSSVTPGNLELSWSPIVEDFSGNPTVVDRYELYGSDTVFSRDDVANGFVPSIASTAGTSLELVPADQRAYMTIIVVDVKGNESPF